MTERLHFTSLHFFEIGIKNDIFQSCCHCWDFQICWHIECSTLIASSFRIWNISAGIPSPPLALFIAMLSNAHLTSCSRMSGSRWVITPLCLCGSWRSFFIQLLFLLSLLNLFYACSAQFSFSVVFNSLRPHGLQHTRPPCPSPTPRACSNSGPSSR